MCLACGEGYISQMTPWCWHSAGCQTSLNSQLGKKSLSGRKALRRDSETLLQLTQFLRGEREGSSQPGSQGVLGQTVSNSTFVDICISSKEEKG